MIDQLKKEYLEWTQNKIKLEQVEDFIEITTPFVDMNHDFISLFFKVEENGYKLSDDGYIIDELSILGIDIDTSAKRKDYFKMTLKIFGIEYNNKTSELFVRFNSLSEYPETQHRLIQCLMRVSDMLITSRNKVISFFTEDITNFFLEKEVFFNESPSYLGKSGRNNTFDFALAKSKKTTPKLIKAVNRPTSDAYRGPLLTFVDIQENKSDHKFIVLANDSNVEISKKFIEPLENYGVSVLPWSDRENWINDLKYS